jgi:hypothetical protein
MRSYILNRFVKIQLVYSHILYSFQALHVLLANLCIFIQTTGYSNHELCRRFCLFFASLGRVVPVNTYLGLFNNGILTNCGIIAVTARIVDPDPH